MLLMGFFLILSKRFKVIKIISRRFSYNTKILIASLFRLHILLCKIYRTFIIILCDFLLKTHKFFNWDITLVFRNPSTSILIFFHLHILFSLLLTYSLSI